MVKAPKVGGGRGGCNERGRGRRVRGGEDARGARRGACVARPCRWTSEAVSGWLGEFGEISGKSGVYGELWRVSTNRK